MAKLTDLPPSQAARPAPAPTKRSRRRPGAAPAGAASGAAPSSDAPRPTADAAYLATKLARSRARAAGQGAADEADAISRREAAAAEGSSDVRAKRLLRDVSMGRAGEHLAGGLATRPGEASQAPDVRAYGGPRPVVAASHVGTRYPRMEDAHAVRWYPPQAPGEPPMGVVAVFDGHGGPQTSHLLAELAPDIVHARLVAALGRRRADGGDVDVAIYAALKDAFAAPRRRRPPPPGDTGAATQGEGKRDAFVAALRRCFAPPKVRQPPAAQSFDQAARGAPIQGSGSTAVVAAIIGSDVYVANLGDSRAVLVGRDGVAQRVSTDHRPGDAREEAKISAPERGGFVSRFRGVPRVNGALATSRAVGDFGLAAIGRRPDIVKLTIDPSADLVLALATDGITDVIGDRALGRLVRAVGGEGGTPLSPAQLEEAARLTVAAADMRYSKDNKTILLVDLAAG